MYLHLIYMHNVHVYLHLIYIHNVHVYLHLIYMHNVHVYLHFIYMHNVHVYLHLIYIHNVHVFLHFIYMRNVHCMSLNGAAIIYCTVTVTDEYEFMYLNLTGWWRKLVIGSKPLTRLRLASLNGFLISKAI